MGRLGGVAAGGAATPASREAREVHVYAAASLSDALGEIAASYQAATGEVIRLNLGASSTLARQIAEGAPADVFFSADEATMDRVERAELLLPGRAARRCPTPWSSWCQPIRARRHRARGPRRGRTSRSWRWPSRRPYRPGSTPRLPRTIGRWSKVSRPRGADRKRPRRAGRRRGGERRRGDRLQDRRRDLEEGARRLRGPPRDGPTISYPVALIRKTPREWLAPRRRGRDFLSTWVARRSRRCSSDYGFLLAR